MPSDGHIVLFRRAPAELNRRNLERFAQVLRDEVTDGGGFQCLVTDDRELRRLNRTFLSKDYATDVLSFPSSEGTPAGRLARLPASPRVKRNKCPAPDDAPHAFLGEIAISAQRARDQAARYGHPIDAEIRILMLHGVLHLLGLDHETDRGRMARAEAAWRLRLALPAGLIQRVQS